MKSITVVGIGNQGAKAVREMYLGERGAVNRVLINAPGELIGIESTLTIPFVYEFGAWSPEYQLKTWFSDPDNMETLEAILESATMVIICAGLGGTCSFIAKYLIMFMNEMYPEKIVLFAGTTPFREEQDVIHLMRGEVYEIDGKRIFVFGGGYSIDKDYRVPGKSWWPEEMPDDDEYETARKHLEACGYKVDYIFTNTAPANTVEYMSRMNMGIKNTVIEESPLTGFLQWVEEKTEYKKWFFGHFHIDRELWKNQIAVLDAIRDMETGEILKMRVPSIY